MQLLEKILAVDITLKFYLPNEHNQYILAV